jgi:hypothetical protein
MFSSLAAKQVRRWWIGGGLAMLALVAGWQSTPVQSEPRPASPDEQSVRLWIDYMEANLKLAETDLQLARLSNKRSHGSVSEFDVQRLELQRDYFDHARSLLNQGHDFGDVAAGYAELNAKLAKLDLESAEKSSQIQPGSISAALLERARHHAEVCRLQAQLARQPAEGSTLGTHLHYETHRLAAEVMQLNRRVSRLEEIALR